MGFQIISLAISLAALYWTYRQSKAEGTWSWTLIVGFFVALGLFGAGYLWPMMNSNWLNAHPDAFVWVIFGPGAVLVGAFYLIAMRIQKTQKARLEAGE